MSCSKNDLSIHENTTQRFFLSFFKKKNGPWMHKTLPLSCHLLTLKTSFKLVSARNMTSTLVWRWIRASHFMFVCTFINIHYNSILIVKFTICQISPKTHYWKRGKYKCKETFGQRVYSQRKKYAMTRLKEIIHHSRLTKQRNQRAKLKWFSIRFSF